MGKFDGVLLASDFDNTILNTEIPRRTGCPIPPISRRNTDALRYFMANGGRFAVATGRALPAFRLFANQIPMNAPAVVSTAGRCMIFKPSPIWISWSCRRRSGDRGRRCWIVSPPRLWRPTIWTT